MPTNQQNLSSIEVFLPARPPWRNVNPCTGVLGRKLPTGLFTTGHTVGCRSHPGVEFTQKVRRGTPNRVAEPSMFLTHAAVLRKVQGPAQGTAATLKLRSHREIPIGGSIVILPTSRIERRRITFRGRTTDAIVAMLPRVRAQVDGTHNRVHASLKSSRGPRGLSVAGSP
jgi:hypothetical protein